MPQATVTTTGLLLLGQNKFRQSVLFRHNGTANKIFIDNMTAAAITTTSAGIFLSSGDAISISIVDDGGREVTDLWAAIADSGSNSLAYKEFSRMPFPDGDV